jgi:hypothetical protein
MSCAYNNSLFIITVVVKTTYKARVRMVCGIFSGRAHGIRVYAGVWRYAGDGGIRTEKYV